jgi:hypothetical protein
MPDVNYGCNATAVAASSSSVNLAIGVVPAGYTTGGVQVTVETSGGLNTDSSVTCVSVFR